MERVEHNRKEEASCYSPCGSYVVLLGLTILLALPVMDGCGESAIVQDGGADGGADGGMDAGDQEVPPAANLLCNPGFEEGDAEPRCWIPFTPSGTTNATFTWEDGTAYTGSRSVSVQNSRPEPAMWQQVLSVTPGQVYLLSGYVSFENVIPPGRCNLQLVFRTENNRLIQMINYPHHDGTREFALDFPTDLKVRAPEEAAKAEINLFLQGEGKAFFDDIFFGLAPVGTISGRVTSRGNPLEGAKVLIWGDPWGKPCQALTDGTGAYELEDVPRAFPRYILLASKAGFKTRAQGWVEVKADAVTTKDFELEPGDDPAEDLRVKFGTLDLLQALPRSQFPADAVIPADETGYPEAVRTFLQPDEFIESDHPAVVQLAQEILEPVENRSSTHDVTWAVYEWVSRNIDHDGVYAVSGEGGLEQPFKDVTSGIWQTISGNGWSFGRSFYDWTYLPHELLEVRGGICVEHAMLGSALLRALNIPARPFSGSLEFWAQTADGPGAWFGLSTTAGRTSFREHGQLGPGFINGGLTSHPVSAGPMVHEDWDAESPGLWKETHPWGESYEGTAPGLNQALTDLEQFSRTGEAPRGEDTPPPLGQDRYNIHYRDVTINLYNIGEQRILDVRFPLVRDSDGHESQGHEVYWTNHQECVVDTRIEETTNPPVEGTERWFHIKFDLSNLLD